jgi:CRISPR/Cas system-associated exonuclease Cas4 (RecB family)
VNHVKWLSVSKIGTFMKCPRQAWYRYVLKTPEPSSGAMMAGRTVHSVVEKALRQVMGGGKLPSAAEMDDWFGPAWEGEVKNEETKPSFLGWQWDADDPEEKVREESRGLVRVAREEVLPTLRPALVEHDFHYDLDAHGSGPFRVYGVVDLFETTGTVSDWKTTKGVTENARKLDAQFWGYAVWHKAHTGRDVMPCQKIFLARGRKKATVEIVRYEVGQRHREFFIETAAEVWKMLQNEGGFVPNTGGWWCAPKWCSFYGICQGELK